MTCCLTEKYSTSTKLYVQTPVEDTGGKEGHLPTQTEFRTPSLLSREDDDKRRLPVHFPRNLNHFAVSTATGFLPNLSKGFTIKKSIFQFQDPQSQNCPISKLSSWGIDQSNQWLLGPVESVFIGWTIYYLLFSPAKFQFLPSRLWLQVTTSLSPESSENCLTLEPTSDSTT